MAQVLLLLVVALTVGAVVFGVMVLVSGGDPGLRGVEPDGRGVPLPSNRPLVEQDVAKVTFDLGLRGYRMDQVDKALKRVAYDIGYKDELINVLTAEVDALRDGRQDDAEVLRAARLAASGETTIPEAIPEAADAGDQPADQPADVAAADPFARAAAAGDPFGRAGAATPATGTEPDGAAEEVPDGPFAPWPPVGTPAGDSSAVGDHTVEAEVAVPSEAATSTGSAPAASPVEADEPDHPTDQRPGRAGGETRQVGSDADRVVSRG